MPFYADNNKNQRGVSRTERKRLARERAILSIEENRYLTRGKGSKLLHFFLYPLSGLITASTTLWWHYTFEEETLMQAKYYLIPLMLFAASTLVASYINDENYFKPELARIREPAIALELSREEKFINREARLERLHFIKDSVAGKEAACYAIFINNALFYAHLMLAYSYFIKSAPTNCSYVYSVITASIFKLSFLYDKRKKC